MKRIERYLVALMVAAGASSVLIHAQAPAAPQPMSYFITSTAKGDGANYGGLAGADAHCQQLAAAVGRGGVTWHAYLSTQGAGAVNARDRIGVGPWYNAKGQMVASNLDELHGDTIERARLGNRLNKITSLTEKGTQVNGAGDMPNQHDILTGSQPDGRAFTDGVDHTCSNWTSNENVAPAARGAAPPTAPAPPVPGAQIGHHDRIGINTGSWNSAHATRGCSQANMLPAGGNGYLYCFAVN